MSGLSDVNYKHPYGSEMLFMGPLSHLKQEINPAGGLTRFYHRKTTKFWHHFMQISYDSYVIYL